MKRILSFIAFFAMLIATLTQVSAFGFCANTMDVFIGEHKVINDSQCSHSQENHIPSNCNDTSKSCEDSHVEIDVEIDDFTRVSPDCETLLKSVIPEKPVYSFNNKHVCAGKQNLLSDLAKITPNLPVFLRFGVMRL